MIRMARDRKWREQQNTQTVVQNNNTTKPDVNKDYIEGEDDLYYKMHDKEVNWFEAKEICESEGADLVIVNSSETFMLVKGMVKDIDWVWLGGRDEHSNNNWKWVNGMEMEMEDSYWFEGEPNNYLSIQENCLATPAQQPGRFFDAPCYWRGPHFICQKDMRKPTPKPKEEDDYKKTFDGKSYKLFSEPKNWWEAMEKCMEGDAVLAMDDSATVHMYIVESFEGKFWIGANDSTVEGVWKWVDGRSIENKHWEDGAPDEDGEEKDCAYMEDGEWSDEECEEEKSFLCQKSAPEPAPEPMPKPTDPNLLGEDGYDQGFDGNYYKYFSEPEDWEDAMKQCADDNAALAIDDSAPVHMYMKKSFPENFWFGASDGEMEGEWKWVDGRTVEKTHWDDNHVIMARSGDKKDCAYMKDDGKWNHDECDEEKPFLCQRRGAFGKCGEGMKCPRQILYPFGILVGDEVLPQGDDEFGHLHFKKGFPFMSRLKSDIYINTNGHVTADKPEKRWEFDSTPEVPIVGVYVMELSTEDGGRISYRVTNDKTILDRIEFEVSLMSTIREGYKPSLAMIVTWNNVRVKDDPSKKLTFQLVYHTDFKIAIANKIYARIDAPGALTGFSEGECNNFFSEESFRMKSKIVKSHSNIGINGIYVQQVSKAECGIPRVSHPMEIKYKSSDVADETEQSFYFNGEDRITNVFTETYTWTFPSVSFATSLVHKLDEIILSYVYLTNAPFKSEWGVGVVVFRDNVDKTGMRIGNIDLEKFWEEKECHRHVFEESMDRKPTILLNAMIPYKNYNNLNGLTNVWLRNVSSDGFNVCYHEMVSFWGPRSISLDYVAVTNESKVFTEMGFKMFKKMENKRSAKSMKIFCEFVNFKILYAIVPAVFITPEEGNRNSSGELIAWVLDIKKTYTVICARNSKDPMDERTSSINVHYTVSGHLNKCSKFQCPAHLECQFDKEDKPFCGCKKNCMDYKQMSLCASNFRTYRSMCELEKFVCEEKLNRSEISVAYEGECKRYPYQIGKDQLESVPGVKVAFCKYIDLDESNFHSGSPMQVLLTVTWDQTGENEMPHEASASWSEDVSINGFKACVLVAGRHFFENMDPPSIHWVAYQREVESTTDDLEVGTVEMRTWYTGSRCQYIKLEKYNRETKILVSVEHSNSRSFKNAMTAWVENISGDGEEDSEHVLKICARELQNFDGVHKGIKIHYLAVHDTIDIFIVEPGRIRFERQKESDKDDVIKPICKTVEFNNHYPKLSDPTVIITAVNTSRNPMRSLFSPHDIAVWVEGNNDTHLTACFKSLRAEMYRETVQLQYAIWPKLCKDDWKWHDNNCYRPIETIPSNNTLPTNETTFDFQAARNHCQSLDAHLPELEHPSKSYYFGKAFSDRGDIWVAKKEEECAIRSDENGMVVNNNCTDNNSFICEKEADLLERGCMCLNDGECEEDDGEIKCDCKDEYTGELCEERTVKSCKEYKSVRYTLIRPELDIGVWYRFPGKKIVEYCPRYSGCASIEDPHPSKDYAMVNTTLVYGNHPMVTPRCEEGYGSVLIQNCDDFYIYLLQSVKDDVDAQLCLERHED